MRQCQDFAAFHSLIRELFSVLTVSFLLLHSTHPVPSVVSLLWQCLPTIIILGGLREGMLVYSQKFQDEMLFESLPVEFF